MYGKFRKVVLAVGLIAFAPAVFAKQPVDVSVTNHFEVDQNVSTFFQSSDWLDLRGSTNDNKVGTVHHTYNHGPKNIKFGIQLKQDSIFSDKPIVNQCAYITDKSLGRKTATAYTNYFRTSGNRLNMTFNIDKDGKLTCALTQE